MVTICEFGTAPEQAMLGYRITSTLIETDAGALALYDGLDVRLVRGAAVFVAPGKCEFAVMTRTDRLYFNNSEQAGRFAAAVIAAGHQASIEYDPDTLPFEDDYNCGVTYSGPEVTQFSQSSYSVAGRRASRFAR
jgi:hypothetical protein